MSAPTPSPSSTPARMPVAFIGHGSPMNALEENRHTLAWRQFGAAIPRPSAVLAVSAHWYTRGLAVTAMEHPRTIHDFGGFPDELFAMQYPAPGSPALARRVQELLAPDPVAKDFSWGLDHGSWSVLVHVFPQHDVPVVQLSIDATRPPAFHYAAGERLAPLRDEGVLILGLGNVVHNLRTARWGPAAAPYDWAARFEALVRDALLRKEAAPLIEWDRAGEAAKLSVPTPEHYLPLLYAAGAQRPDDGVSILTEGIDLGSVSMLSFAAAPAQKRDLSEPRPA